MCGYKRALVVVIVFSVFLLSGCRIASKAEIESKETSVRCVEESGDSISELYDIFIVNNIEWIEFADGNSSLDRAINIAYDDKYYLVSTPEGNKANPSKTDFLRACEIIGQLNSNYSVDSIHYFADTKSMQIRFSNNSRAILYSPECLPEKHLNDEKIKDGFYTYMLKPMF
jgi:hypothetical protein